MAVKAVVLAAGAGTRMKSSLPKVLHEVAGRPMISWVLDAVAGIRPDEIVVVVGHQREAVRAALPDSVATAVQHEQFGTGHATQVALAGMGDLAGDVVVVLPGDTPLLTPATLSALVALRERTGSAASLLTTELDDPTGYGRVVRDQWERVTGIVEQKDADPEELAIREINAGVYAFAGEHLADALGKIDDDNAQGEFYLTDVVGVFATNGRPLSALKADAEEVSGVNDHRQLSGAATVLRRRINETWMREGVWMEDPHRTYIDHGVRLEPGVRLYAGVHLRGDSSIGQKAEVGPEVLCEDSTIGPGATVVYSVVRGATIGEGVAVGPYASLRPGTILEDDSKVGTFVETKNTRLGRGAKAPHLTYLGDADVGEESNIGAGTITANYDGTNKHKTTIGRRVFVGSDTMLVAPVSLGDEAYTGAGSVITSDVEAGALAVERSQQKQYPGYAARRKQRQQPPEA